MQKTQAMVACKLRLDILSLLLALSFGTFRAEGRDDNIVIHWEGNSSAEAASPDPEDAEWDSSHVFVLPNGEIRPARLHPAFRSNPTKEKPLSILTETRIIGGQNAKGGEVPYQIGILRPYAGIFCGGTLFNSDTVLTAAHCFFESGKMLSQEVLKGLHFIAGENDIETEDGNEQGPQMTALFIHPNYAPRNSLNDIAVVKLRTRYSYNKYVQPLSIGNPPVEGLAGDEAVVSGWGYTKVKEQGQPWLSGYRPRFLQWTSIDMWTKKDCIAAFPRNQNYRKYAASDAVIW